VRNDYHLPRWNALSHIDWLGRVRQPPIGAQLGRAEVPCSARLPRAVHSRLPASTLSRSWLKRLEFGSIEQCLIRTAMAEAREPGQVEGVPLRAL
jgi:hypothetical protein